MKCKPVLAVFVCVLLVGSLRVSADSGIGNTENTATFTPSPSIIGGVDAPISDYPWMVALMSDGFWGNPAQFCGGVLIAPDVVLTAAHCAEQVYPFLTNVIVGSQDWSTAGLQNQFMVAEVHIHPGYIFDWLAPTNDIAILKLFQTTPFPTISIIDQATMDQIVVGDLMTHMGWGIRDQYNSSPGVLQEVQLPLVDQMVCDDVFVNGTLGDNQFCAGYATGGKSACSGDSGGPMVHKINDKWRLTGIVSQGILEQGCGQPGNYNVFMKVSYYKDWINAVVNKVFINLNQHPIIAGISESNEWMANVVNLTSEVATIADMALSGDTAAFTVNAKNCLTSNIQPGKDCALSIKFKSKLPGEYSADLSVNLSNGINVSQVISARAFDLIAANAALDTHEWTWYSGGGAQWNTDPLDMSINGSALRSGAVDYSQNSTLLTYIEGPGTLSFNWKVSADPYYDSLQFSIDNKVIKSIVEAQNWVAVSVHLDEGTHAVQWTYNQNSYFPFGSSTGWVDNIAWTLDPN